jgi:peptidoglycan/xylan/chitin deacetylase (PgdA/CDA1 family)
MQLHLILHGLGPVPAHASEREARYWLSTETFARVLDLAAASRNRVAITFDDGNDTDVRLALPALRRAGMTATFFILSDSIGRPGFVGEDDIRALRHAGMEIGSHGAAHLCWTKASDEEIARDVTRSIARLEDILGEEVTSVAVPFGDCDLRVLRVLRGLGIGRVHTSFRGPDSDESWIVHRNCLMAEMPDRAIETLLMRRYGMRDYAMAFLRAFRHVSWAAFWPAMPSRFKPFEIQFEQPSPHRPAPHVPWGTLPTD